MPASKTTPPLRGTPPREGNDSPSAKGWQAKPDGVVPKLRFPEFRDAEEWEAKLLGAVCEMQAGKFVAASEISEKQAEGFYPCFGGNGLRGYTKTFNQSGRYSLIGRQGALCGNVNLAEGNFYATEHAVVTTPKLGNSTDWLFYNLCLLNLNRFATGQAQPGLSIDVLEKVNCAIPKDEKEQQKIADCLASIDELITAQTQKLDALKTHKKGLMQQLFPAEGETVPKLRFPEFRGKGVWKNTQLGKIGEFTGGGTPTKSNDSYWQGDIPWISSSDIYDDSIHEFNISRYITEDALNDSATKLVPENSILLVSRVGVGKLAISKNSVCTSQDFTNFTPVKDDLVFLGYYLKSKNKTFLEYSQGMAIKGFTKNDISELDIQIPSIVEQQKISDCLASIDELISNQANKVKALKAHKKGLMQQLFPAMDEASA